jgi:hypothetical protein
MNFPERNKPTMWDGTCLLRFTSGCNSITF